MHRLPLPKYTVETHITNILNKLGLASRIQLSRWMGEVTGPGRPRVGSGPAAATLAGLDRQRPRHSQPDGG